MNNFYVYAILDPSNPGSFQYRDSRIFDHIPMYIGKGKDKRCFEHLGQLKSAKKISTYLYNKMRKIKRETGLDPIIIKLYENLTEDQAFETEIFLIKQLGRHDQKRGPLTNLTDGGDGPTGVLMSVETREKISISLSGKNRSRETRNKISLSRKGKKFSEEHKKNLSAAHKGKYPSEETIEKMRKSREEYLRRRRIQNVGLE